LGSPPSEAVQRRFESKVPAKQPVFVIGLDMRVISVFPKTNEQEIEANDNPSAPLSLVLCLGVKSLIAMFRTA
jgi:hypothetical protein